MKTSTKLALSRPYPNSQSLWDDVAHGSTSLGCWPCIDRTTCGGAHKEAGFFDCNDYCRCSDKEACDLVCRGNPASFVERVREIGGFDLMNAPRAPKIEIAALPSMIPLIEHNSARQGKLNFPIVAIPLHKLVDLNEGTVRFADRETLSRQFGIDPNSRLVVSGVGRDRKIERYWALPNRPTLLTQLQLLGVELITPPNFSVLTDVPRTDNLHAMKRILIACVEMIQAGLPTALHINARTERDYKRWTDLIAAREEIQCLAFEFATGAGRGTRIDWHVERLSELAADIGRPLRLVLRGGIRKLELLRKSFDAVTVIDTDAFNKSRCRMKASFSEAGKLVWRSHPTGVNQPIDDLLQHNVVTLYSHHTYLERLHLDCRLAQSVRAIGIAKNRNRQAI